MTSTSRSLPFWSWNDRLSPRELLRQIGMMREQSLGGFFMHARGGLFTGYMSPRWMECVESAIDEARRLGLQPWLYDENGWPSGFASGQIPALGDEYRQKSLRFASAPGREIGTTANLLSVYDGGSNEPLCAADLDPERTYNLVYYEVNPYYVDLLDGRVTEAFLRFTHERYRRRLSSERWNHLEGFFTDEPQLSRTAIPWSSVLPGEFRKEYGENLIELLPQLFVAAGEYRRTRYRFWRLVTALFSRNFFARLNDWCDRQGLKLTGHLVKEERLLEQLTANGAVMPHYEYFHIPGIDWLGRGPARVTTTRQVTSAAAQLGKREVLSESFALCGWGVRFEELKTVFQQQMVHGVTLLCPHLQAYSLRGLRKRDYPPALSYQQPWWPDWHVLMDYISRIGGLIASSDPTATVAVVHPQSSAWVNFGGGEHRRIEEIDSLFLKISETLEQAGIEYHYADETLLERHGSQSGGELRLGRQSYRCVVVPLVDNLAAGTVRLLLDFAAAGGCLLMFDSGPILVSGFPDEAAGELYRRAEILRDVASLPARLAPYSAVIELAAAVPGVRISSAPRPLITATRRRLTDFRGKQALLYYLVSQDGRAAQNVFVTLEEGQVVRYRAESDTWERVYPEQKRRGSRLRFTFPPCGDLMLLVFPYGLPESLRRSGARKPGKPLSGQERTVTQLRIADRFTVRRETTDNILLLDYCSYTAGDGERVTGEPVSVVHDRLLSTLRPAELRLEFSFTVEEGSDIAAGIYLVVENPADFRIRVNGVAVQKAEGWIFDRSFVKFPIGAHLQAGLNTVTLETHYRQSPDVYRAVEQAASFEAEKNKLTFESEIEAVYLVGRFGVTTPGTFEPLSRNAVRYHGPFRLARSPADVDIRALHASGFPFFAGTLSACKKVKLPLQRGRRYYLECDRIGANSVAVEINGRRAGSLFWRPYRLPISDLLVDGENEITLHLTTSLRNMLGPHHLQAGESHFVGPFSFFKEDGVFSRNWDGTLNEWTDDYCFLDFGVQGLRISREEETE